MKQNPRIEVWDELTPERRTSVNTQDYRLALSREGPHAADWADKPHRLVYDLCNEVDRLAKHSKRLLESLAAMTNLCRIKYGNLDKDVYVKILEAEAAIAAGCDDIA